MKALIGWMARNTVAANLLMAVLLIGGLVSLFGMKQEVFPEFDPESVTVSVSYPGASPEDVEQGVLLAIEDAVSGLEDVDEITSRASEGSGTVTIELVEGADVDKAVDDARSAVSTIASFPDEAETPEVAQASRRREVLTVMVSGPQDLRDLHELALDLEERITASDDASVVEVSGAPARTLDIEVRHEVLEAYDLTLSDLASQVSAASLQRGAGTVRTASGDLTVRVDDRRTSERDFATIPIVTGGDGSTVRLGDVARITGGYEDSDASAWLDGERAVRVQVYRVGEETPSAVSAATLAAVESVQAQAPVGARLTVLNDSSEVLQSRLDLLGENAIIGLLLVLGILALFLDLRTALWVSMGIPISFLGSFVFLQWFGVSINMVSLFAFLVVLGLVVDDAIVVGEQIYYEREQGHGGEKGATRGAVRMIGPVLVAVLTTVFAFAPIQGIPGHFGKIFGVFPVIIIAVLGLSTLESFFILPAHLSHGGGGRFWNITEPVRRWFSRWLLRFIEGPYRRLVRLVVTHRLLAYASAFAALLVTAGVVGGGWVPIRFFPDIAGETITATAQLPPGTSDSEVRDTRSALEEAARAAAEQLGVTELVDGIEGVTSDGDSGTEQIVVRLHLSSEDSDLDTNDVASAWSDLAPRLPPEATLAFRATMGPSGGEAVNVSLSHSDPEILEAASERMRVALREYTDITNIESSLSQGTDALELRLNAHGEALGLTTDALSSQVRAAFEGAEAFREIDGRTERTVQVRLPREERVERSQVADLPVRLTDGAWAPLSTVADVVPGIAPAVIERSDGRREVAVTADLAPGVDSASEVLAEIQASILPDLLADTPGLEGRMRGQVEEQQESTMAMLVGFGLALFGIYALLAATFRSYFQPIVVMSIIPFSIVGAVFGHALVGLPLSMISAFGVIALAGVVVNDSLVLVDAANELRQQGLSPLEAVTKAGERRFRPILLTSLTTFLGLAPMILETSVQAQFLIPMAVSLGFGILVATVVVLVFVPVIYLTLEDVLGWFRRAPREEAPPEGLGVTP